jgi:hypothetical protein
VLEQVSGPNGEGLPTHVLVTDELVEKAVEAYGPAGMEEDELRESMREVLSEVAPELWQAGYDAGRRRIAEAIFDES